MKKHIITIALLLACSHLGHAQTESKILKSDAEWQKILSQEEYHVLREKGTEIAFTGTLLNESREGTFVCKACANPLFNSTSKFKSGTGWPSFYEAIPGKVSEEVDTKFGMTRTEILCNKCDGHLGHVFTDGPKPTGLRYCVNSISLEFKENK